MALDRHNLRLDRLDPSASDGASRLHDEAIEASYGRRLSAKERSRLPLDLDQDGHYQVQKGDTMLSIAKRSLLQKGEDASDKSAVLDEAARIARINLGEYPEIWFNPRSLSTSMNLKIKDENASGEPSPVDAKPATETARLNTDSPPVQERIQDCDAKPFTPTDKLTFARECDRVDAREGARVVLEPGAKAIIHEGATGFGFAGSHAIVLPGGKFIAAGGDVDAYPGAKIMESAASRIVVLEQ